MVGCCPPVPLCDERPPAAVTATGGAPLAFVEHEARPTTTHSIPPQAMNATPEIVDNEAAGRFEIHVPEGTPQLQYVRRDGVVQLVHTEVPEALEGRGFGAALAKAALDAARAAGLKVVPTCPFVRTYIRRHPEYADLVVER